jgi:ankyrin repeat protein
VLISKAELFIICKVILFCDCSATAKRLNPAFDQGQGPAGMSAKEKAMTACCGGNVPALAALLRSGEVTVNMRCSKTQQPLIHTAAYCGQVGVVMYLLQEGADLKLLDSENDTVLHFACMKTIPQGRHDTTLEFLLSTVEGSKLVNSQNNSGDTPLLVAVKCGFVSRALLMLKYKADPLVGNHKKELPLHRACGDNDNMELVMSLVEVTDINTKDGDGWTPLMFACKGSSQFMVRYLLQRGADPNIPQVLFSGICTYVHVHNSTTH